MKKVVVAGLRVDAGTKAQVLEAIESRLRDGRRTFVITPYSEFLYAALRNPDTLELLNRADISVADGIVILWAAKFLSLPLTAKSFHGKIIQALWQMKYTLAAVVFNPAFIRTIIPEKIVGAELFSDLVKLAHDHRRSIYLLGGFGDTPQQVRKALLERYPALKVVGASNKDPGDPSILRDIADARPDFLFVAYGPIRQERWIIGHWGQIGVKLAIGLGGTFDYVAGTRRAPPALVRSSGWEWLFRLVTQPQRVGRIMDATFGLLRALLRYKVFNACPYRPNVVCVIVNRQGQVLICRRKPGHPADRLVGETSVKKFANYWQLPQGGIDTGEDAPAAALREAFEETGLTGLRVLLQSSQTHTYEYRQANRRLWFNSRAWKGQRQSIAYLRHDGPDDAVRVDNNEFTDYQWIAPSQLAAIVHPERLPVVEIVLKDLENLA